MTRSFLSLACVALCACASAATAATTYVLERIDRALAFVFDVLARPLDLAPSFSRLATAGHAPAFYDAPPQHDLRHEAGTSRRSAARNV